MNLTETQKQQIIQAVLTAAITLVLAIASILGYNLGIKPAFEAEAIGVQGLQVQKFQSPVRFQQAVTADSTLAVTGVTTLGTANITAANATALTVGGYTQSGAVRFGTAATYTTGASITHGFAVTPTMCIMTPIRDVTSTLTITATGFSSNRATQAETMYWICGK